MVKVCDICGDKGFWNALLVCSKCSVIFVHQYCLGIPPGSIDDTFEWVCEFCSGPIETESCRKFGALQSCNGDFKKDSRTQIIAFPEQPEPLCTLPPIQDHAQEEFPISPFMENPNSIMRGIVLIVSPLGEVFIEEEKEKGICETSYFSSLVGHIRKLSKVSRNLGNYKARRDLTPLGKTNSEAEGSKEKDDVSLLSTTTGLNVEVSDHGITILENKSDNGRLGKCLDYPVEYKATPPIVGCKPEIWSDNSVESSMNGPERGKRKKILKAKTELIHKKKAKIKGEDEGPSCEPVFRTKSGSNGNLSSETVAKNRLRNKIVAMLLSAGWNVEFRERKTEQTQRSRYKDKVYVNPEGTAYWSLPRAYYSLVRDYKKAKARKAKTGNDNGNSDFSFKPLSKKLLIMLSRSDRRSKKN